MISVVIIDYFTPNRTIKYIKDFIQCSDIKDISFVIVDNSVNDDNYNNLNSLCVKNFVGSYRRSCNTIKDIENLIIGNPMYYQNIDDRIDLVIVKSKENGGFARGNNLGFKIAMQYLMPSYVLFSNNDILFPKSIFKLSFLVRNFEKDKSIAMIGPKVVGLDEKDQSPAVYMPIEKRFWYKQLLWPLTKIVLKEFDHIENDLIENSPCGFVYRIIGAFMLAEVEKFKEVGMFDENTFLYGEEPILSERYKKRGYKVYFDNNVTIIHEEGASTSSKNNIHNIIIQKKRAYVSEKYYYQRYMNVCKFKLIITSIIQQIYFFKLNLAEIIISLRNKGDIK